MKIFWNILNTIVMISNRIHFFKIVKSSMRNSMIILQWPKKCFSSFSAYLWQCLCVCLHLQYFSSVFDCARVNRSRIIGASADSILSFPHLHPSTKQVTILRTYDSFVVIFFAFDYILLMLLNMHMWDQVSFFFTAWEFHNYLCACECVCLFVSVFHVC